MRIIGMMAFYDEPLLLLERSLSGLSLLGARRIVAMDGAYALLPGGKESSPPRQIKYLKRGCRMRGIKLHHRHPISTWSGNEVEKRQAMLDVALKYADEDCWLAIWDCDYRLLSAPPAAEIAKRLRSTTCDVATIAFTEDPSANSNGDFYPMGMFLRALPGIKMDGNHHTYLLPDGRRTQVLRRPVENEARAPHFPDIRVLHAVHARDPERRARQAAYYSERDRLGVER